MDVLVAAFGDPVWFIPLADVDRLRRRFPQHRFIHATTGDALREGVRAADVALSSMIGGDLLPLAARLRWVHSPAAGVGRLLSPPMLARDIVVTNSRGLHGVPIAEHVIGVTIALSRQLPAAVRRQARHEWHKPAMAELRTLAGRHVGIIGLGAVGGAIARLASAVGMRVSALRRHPDRPAPDVLDAVFGPADLLLLLARSDVVVVACPLTEETRGLIGSRELRGMKREALLVNVARGKLVREDDLVTELRAGTIAGAALDVFEHEPLDPDSPLWDLPNVLITPHTSAFFADYWSLATDLFAENLRRFERGEPLLNVVDKAAGY
jgi:phosphoglycerate dehydrogenase-like enzyme